MCVRVRVCTPVRSSACVSMDIYISLYMLVLKLYVNLIHTNNTHIHTHICIYIYIYIYISFYMFVPTCVCVHVVA